MTRSLVLLFLVTLSTSAAAEQFSIKCYLMQAYYVTFDTETKRVVYESPGSDGPLGGSATKGTINSEISNELKFELVWKGMPKFDLVWDSSTRRLTWIGVSSDSTRPTKVFECERVDPRPILSMYDRIGLFSDGWFVLSSGSNSESWTKSMSLRPIPACANAVSPRSWLHCSEDPARASGAHACGPHRLPGSQSVGVVRLA